MGNNDWGTFAHSVKKTISYFMLEQLLLPIGYEEEKTNKQAERNQYGEE